VATKLGTIVADFTTQLATAMAVGATTASLQSATDDDGVALPSGVYFFAIDGNNSQKEHIVATLSGTSLTGISSISRQGVQASGVMRSHRVGSTVTLTDFAHIKYINDLVSGATTFNAATPLGYDGTATISTANQFATKAYVDGVAIAGAADSSTTVKGITKMSVAPVLSTSPIAVGDNDGRVPTQNENDALVGTSGTAVSSSNKLVDAADVATTSTASKIVRANGSGKIDTSWAAGKFGGTGADGALSVTSGTTTIDCGGASVVVKNYTSISITGTGVLAFSNPGNNGTLVILKSQGNVTLTSSATPMINGSAIGGLGGAAVTVTTTTSAGNNGGNAIATAIFQSNAGTGAATSAGGTAGAVATPLLTSSLSPYLLKYPSAMSGSGGGSGMANSNSSSGTAVSGAGGRGGGGLIIECAGAWNFTTSSGISVAGANGSNATAANSSFAGGGGGGAGGYFLALYGTLTASSGSVTVSGGTGGNSKNTSGNAAYGGGGGGFIAAGSSGSASTTDNAKTGGDGAPGFSLIAANTEFF
jgi:hypothetical protein